MQIHVAFRLNERGILDNNHRARLPFNFTICSRSFKVACVPALLYSSPDKEENVLIPPSQSRPSLSVFADGIARRLVHDSLHISRRARGGGPGGLHFCVSRDLFIKLQFRFAVRRARSPRERRRERRGGGGKAEGEMKIQRDV